MKKNSFEEAMARLAEITNSLENNELTLDESMALFEEGLKLVKECDALLKEFETKAKQLIEQYGESEDE